MKLLAELTTNISLTLSCSTVDGLSVGAWLVIVHSPVHKANLSCSNIGTGVLVQLAGEPRLLKVSDILPVQ